MFAFHDDFRPFLGPFLLRNWHDLHFSPLRTSAQREKCKFMPISHVISRDRGRIYHLILREVILNPVYVFIKFEFLEF